MFLICKNVLEENQGQVDKKITAEKEWSENMYVYVNTKMPNPFPKKLDLMVSHLDLLPKLDNEDRQSTPLKRSGSHPSYPYWIWGDKILALRP